MFGLKKQEKIVDYLSYYVEPHKKKSREVKEKDLKRVVKDSEIMYHLCYTKRGLYPGAFAIAHQQITKNDPLRFFATREGEIIINPVIIRHTEVPVNLSEGCLSFPTKKPKMVQRYWKCDVEYQTINRIPWTGELDKDPNIKIKLTEKKIEKAKGIRAQVFQHELGHMEGELIYFID